jgi:iron(III) transport system substrate-binding protein
MTSISTIRPDVRLFALAFAASFIASVPVSAAAAQDQEVVVYSSRSHYGAESVFEDFTKATGIKVRFFNGNNNEVIDRLTAEGERTEADVLLTVDAGNLWLAASRNLLQPITSEVLTGNIPAHLRDPQNRWFAIAVRARTIMYSTARVKPSELSTYEALGDPKWKGRLCLRSSTAVYNQSLLASLIRVHGEQKVESMVRAWVANEPVYINGDTQILEAIGAGRCDVGITNSYYLGRLLNTKPDVKVRPFWADQQGSGTHVNVSGGGVTRHAKRRANAVRLLEYLSTADAQRTLSSASFEFPANASVPPHAILTGWGTFKPQTIGVAAAGEFQAAAVKLADRAGYR